MPLISHPDIDDPVDVPESAVRVHEKSGWSRVDDGKGRGKSKSKTAPEAEDGNPPAESPEPEEA